MSADFHEQKIAERSTSLKQTLQTLDEWMNDPEVNEIMIVRPGEVRTWVRGVWVKREAPEVTYAWLERLGIQISSYTSSPFSKESPELSAYLPGGERVELTCPPACPSNRIYLNLRKPSTQGIPFEKFIEQGYFNHTRHIKSFGLTETQRGELKRYLSPEQAELWELAENNRWPDFLRKLVGHRQNLVVSGATGSGKTSFIRAMVEMIPHDEHIITVEDTPEMPLPNHEISQHLFYKKAGAKVGMTAKEALQACMRKTPTRVLLAELRGDETFYYIQNVLNSGHPGGFTTVHSNSPNDAFLRLALLVKASPEGMTLHFEEVMRMLYSLVHVVVQLVFDHEKGRHCPAIYFDPMYSISLMK